MTESAKPESRSLETEQQIEAVCNRFEAAWKAGQRPVLEQHLDEISPDGRAALLAELVKLDVHYRRQMGEEPTPAEYAARFPDYAELLPALFTEAYVGSRSEIDNDALAGTVIGGRYKLREKLGEGGMGSVWLAQQSEPVQRNVAVKLIKAGMDSKQVVARFEAERQALAVMDHPNIAKVLDGGLHDGRPYFVMELVKGVPITKYCDAKKLTPRERLELFVPVCQAIQHAHQKGIIHRDIKPSNVLIAPYDDRPVPKVIDFGLAKATGVSLIEPSQATNFAAVVGTPQYMSPEQASLNNLDIDTRSDVYSLGVLLYELLTGSPPFRQKELDEAGMLEILRVIREVDPPKPSTKLSTAEALPSISANRGTEPKKLTSLLRNELDWIVMKALEKDRTRRYETANGFAADINRYLAGEPVNAHPPSAAYKLKKFLRKNKGPVIAASLVLAALVAGITGTSWGMWQAKQSAEAERIAKQDADDKRREAEEAADAEKKANEQTQKRLAQIERGVEMFAGMLTGINPRAEEKGGPTIYEQLQERAVKAADELDRESVGDPLAVARLQSILGETLSQLGNSTKAVFVLEKALATQVQLLGREHPDTLTSMSRLGASFDSAGQFDKAKPLHEETLRLRKAILGADDPNTVVSMNSLARNHHLAGQYELALPLWGEALRLAKTKLGADHKDTLFSMTNLATGLRYAGQLDKALPLWEEALRLTRAKLGNNHYDTLTTMSNLAEGYSYAGRHKDALPLQEEAFRLTRSKLGESHPATLTCMNNLAIGYRESGQPDKALPLMQEALRLTKAKLGADNPATLSMTDNLAGSYSDAGQLDKALPLWEESLRVTRIQLGPDHPSTLTCMNNLALGYHSAGQLYKALPLMEETLRLTKGKLGSNHPDTLRCINNLATAYSSDGKLDKALPLLEEALPLLKAQLGSDHPGTLATMSNLAAAYRSGGQHDKAVPLLEETLRLITPKLGADHPLTLRSMNNLATGYQSAGQLDKAVPLLVETLRLRKDKLGPDHPDTLMSTYGLADGYRAAGQLDKALPLFEQAASGIEKRDYQSEHAARIVTNAISCYEGSKEFAKAESWRRKWLAHVKEKTGADSPPFAAELAGLGGNLVQQKRFAEAETVLRECLAIRERIQPDVWATFNTMSLIGAALLGQKKYADAEPLLLKGYEGMKQREEKIPTSGGAELRIPEALDRLIELCTATGKADEAKKWEAERATYRGSKAAEKK